MPSHTTGDTRYCSPLFISYQLYVFITLLGQCHLFNNALCTLKLLCPVNIEHDHIRLSSDYYLVLTVSQLIQLPFLVFRPFEWAPFIHFRSRVKSSSISDGLLILSLPVEHGETNLQKNQLQLYKVLEGREINECLLD